MEQLLLARHVKNTLNWALDEMERILFDRVCQERS